MPIANKETWKKDYDSSRKIHLKKLADMRPVTTPRWGGTYNGVREFKQHSYNHVTNNLKRAQMQEERHHAINVENMLLLDKVVGIAGRNSSDPTREFLNGVRLTPSQVPIVDHFLSDNPTTFGSAMSAVSLNIAQRRRETAAIEAENRLLLSRLYNAKPTYDTASMLERERPERGEGRRRVAPPVPGHPRDGLAAEEGLVRKREE